MWNNAGQWNYNWVHKWRCFNWEKDMCNMSSRPLTLNGAFRSLHQCDTARCPGTSTISGWCSCGFWLVQLVASLATVQQNHKIIIISRHFFLFSSLLLHVSFSQAKHLICLTISLSGLISHAPHPTSFVAYHVIKVPNFISLTGLPSIVPCGTMLTSLLLFVSTAQTILFREWKSAPSHPSRVALIAARDREGVSFSSLELLIPVGSTNVFLLFNDLTRFCFCLAWKIETLAYTLFSLGFVFIFTECTFLFPWGLWRFLPWPVYWWPLKIASDSLVVARSLIHLFLSLTFHSLNFITWLASV